MAEITAEVLNHCVVLGLEEGRLCADLEPPHDVVAVRIAHGRAITLLIVDRALLERGDVVRVRG